MTFLRAFICFLCVLLFVPINSFAQESEGGFLNDFLNVLGQAAMEAAEEEVDEYAGTYKGKIGEVRLVERRGNSVTFEVQYDGVKRTDGVYVHGEVLRGGEPMKDFSSTISQVTDRNGKVILTMGWDGGQEDPWGIFSEDIASDQVRLYLLRETQPDRPFGVLIYGFDKVWSASNEVENLNNNPGASSDFVELAEGEGNEGTNNGPVTFTPVFVGTVMRPVYTVPAQAAPGQSQQSANATVLANPALMTIGVDNYDFYDNADKAVWRSRKKILPFPGSTNDKRGFAKKIPQGYLSTGNMAKFMLETHPQWKKEGWINGVYPAFVLGQNVKFMAVAGFLKGVRNSDGVTFSVFVNENGKNTRILKKKVDHTRYERLEADVSAFAGKKVRFILHVDAGRHSAQDWAVWVKPRLVKK